jgi:hypothetical protein
MKQVKNLFLTALATFAFAGCSNNDEMVGKDTPDTIPTGVETYASFSFKMEGNNKSRAAMTDDTNVDEAALADGRLLIFDNVTGILLNNEEFGAGNLTIKTTSGARRIYIVTGTKDKANLADLDGLTANVSTLTDFYRKMAGGKYTGSPENDTDMNDAFKQLIETGKFVLSNVADINAVKTLLPGIGKEASQGGTSTSEDESVNRFKFNVYRPVAKGRLKVQLKETSLITHDGIFELKSAVTYGVRNVNRATMYVQQFSNDMVEMHPGEHDAEAGLRPHAAFYDVFNASTDDQMKNLATYRPYYFGGYAITGADAVTTTMTFGTDVPTAGKTVYFSENSNNRQVNGNSTYYGITNQVNKIDKNKIAASITFDTDMWEIHTTASASDFDNTDGDKSFWYAREIPADIQKIVGEAPRVFVSESVAFQAMAIIVKASNLVKLTTAGFTNNAFSSEQLNEAFTNATKENPIEPKLNEEDVATVKKYIGYYKDGKSYYRLDLYEASNAGDKRHFVRRNHIYDAKVTSFASIGFPEEGDLDKDPDQPVDADVTHVTAVINVQEWHTINMEDDL